MGVYRWLVGMVREYVRYGGSGGGMRVMAI